jgi:hypothetical protein
MSTQYSRLKLKKKINNLSRKILKDQKKVKSLWRNVLSGGEAETGIPLARKGTMGKNKLTLTINDQIAVTCAAQ